MNVEETFTAGTKRKAPPAHPSGAKRAKLFVQPYRDVAESSSLLLSDSNASVSDDALIQAKVKKLREAEKQLKDAVKQVEDKKKFEKPMYTDVPTLTIPDVERYGTTALETGRFNRINDKKRYTTEPYSVYVFNTAYLNPVVNLDGCHWKTQAKPPAKPSVTEPGRYIKKHFYQHKHDVQLWRDIYEDTEREVTIVHYRRLQRKRAPKKKPAMPLSAEELEAYDREMEETFNDLITQPPPPMADMILGIAAVRSTDLNHVLSMAELRDEVVKLEGKINAASSTRIRNPKGGELYLFNVATMGRSCFKRMSDDGYNWVGRKEHKVKEYKAFKKSFKHRLYDTEGPTDDFKKYMTYFTSHQTLCVQYVGDHEAAQRTHPRMRQRLARASRHLMMQKMRELPPSALTGPTAVLKALATQDPTPGEARSLFLPVGLRQTRYALDTIRESQTLTDETANVANIKLILGEVYVAKHQVEPGHCYVLINNRAIEQLNFILNNTEDDVPLQLHMDHTFNYGNRFVTPLTIRNPLLHNRTPRARDKDPRAIMPIATMFHDRKASQDVDYFFQGVKETLYANCSKFMERKKILVTDREFRGTYMENTERVYCWSHIVDNWDRASGERKMSKGERQIMKGHLYELMKQTSLEEFHEKMTTVFATEVYQSTAGQEMVTYFQNNLQEDIETRAGRWILEKLELPDAQNGITNNASESYNNSIRIIKPKAGTKVNAAKFILNHHYYENQCFSMFTLGRHGRGNLKIPEHYIHLERDIAEMPSLLTKTSQTTIEELKRLLDHKNPELMDMTPPAQAKRKAAVRQLQMLALPLIVSDPPRVMHCYGPTSVWNVYELNDKCYNVTITGKGSCSCTTNAYCHHILAAKYVSGMQNNLEVPKGVRVPDEHTAIRSKSGKRVRHGGKKPTRADTITPGLDRKLSKRKKPRLARAVATADGAEVEDEVEAGLEAEVEAEVEAALEAEVEADASDSDSDSDQERFHDVFKTQDDFLEILSTQVKQAYDGASTSPTATAFNISDNPAVTSTPATSPGTHLTLASKANIKSVRWKDTHATPGTRDLTIPVRASPTSTSTSPGDTSFSNIAKFYRTKMHATMASQRGRIALPKPVDDSERKVMTIMKDTYSKFSKVDLDVPTNMHQSELDLRCIDDFRLVQFKKHIYCIKMDDHNRVTIYHNFLSDIRWPVTKAAAVAVSGHAQPITTDEGGVIKTIGKVRVRTEETNGNVINAKEPDNNCPETTLTIECSCGMPNMKEEVNFRCKGCHRNHHQACIDENRITANWKCNPCKLPSTGLQWGAGKFTNTCSGDGPRSMIEKYDRDHPEENFLKDLGENYHGEGDVALYNSIMALRNGNHAESQNIWGERIQQIVPLMKDTDGPQVHERRDLYGSIHERFAKPLNESVQFIKTRSCANGEKCPETARRPHVYNSVEIPPDVNDLQGFMYQLEYGLEEECFTCKDDKGDPVPCTTTLLGFQDPEKPPKIIHIDNFANDTAGMDGSTVSRKISVQDFMAAPDTLKINGREYEKLCINVNSHARRHYYQLFKEKGEWMVYDGLQQVNGKQAKTYFRHAYPADMEDNNQNRNEACGMFYVLKSQKL